MIKLLEDYIRNNWDNFHLPFSLPQKLSYLLVKGFRKTIFLVFRDNDSHPFAALKVSNDPIAFDRLKREYQTLSYLRAKGFLRGSVPIPFASFDIKGHKCLFASALEGTPLVYFMKGIKTKRGLMRMTVIYNYVVDTLVSLHETSLIQDADRKKQTVIEHGDFNPSNLFVSKTGIHIFDWEYSKLKGTPLVDLLDFSLNYVFFARYLMNEIYYRELPVLQDFEETFLSDNAYSKIIWKHINVYSDKIGINKASIQDIFFTFSRKYLHEPDIQSFCRNLDTVL
jgi:hypothetical protein